MNNTQNGKGDSRRKENLNQIIQNWDQIEWRDKGTYCINCGNSFFPKQKRILNSDGTTECIICNFN